MRGTDGIVQPLRSWRVRNFKSITCAQVDLSPLTVFVGANSSGKSSLLQSILLVVQAMQGQSGEEHLPLNGPYVELGEFDDVRHAGATARDRIGLGGTFALSAPERHVRPARIREGDRDCMQRTVMEWDVELLNTGRENLPGRARLRGLRFSIGSGHGQGSMSNNGPEALEYSATVLSRRHLDLRVAPRRTHLQPVVRLEGRVTGFDAADRLRSFRTVGVSHRAGIPVAVFVQGDLHAVLTAEWVRRARQALRDRRRNPNSPPRASGSGRA